MDDAFGLVEVLPLVVGLADDGRLDDDERPVERDDEEREEEARPPFCASNVMGSTSAVAMHAIPICLSILHLAV